MAGGIGELKGQEREIGQELMRLPREGRLRAIEAVLHDSWGYRESRLKTYEPEIIYSTGRVGLSLYFFAQAVGQYHCDLGRMLDWNDTNMSVAGCLCNPLAFTRKELRVYPKMDHDGRFGKLVAASFLKDWKGQSYTALRGGAVEFRALPRPENKYNRERSFNVVEYLNERQTPCWAFDVPKHYSATEPLMVTLEQDLPTGVGEWKEEQTRRCEDIRRAYEDCKGMELICVMVGALDAPGE